MKQSIAVLFVGVSAMARAWILPALVIGGAILIVGLGLIAVIYAVLSIEGRKAAQPGPLIAAVTEPNAPIIAEVIPKTSRILAAAPAQEPAVDAVSVALPNGLSLVVRRGAVVEISTNLMDWSTWDGNYVPEKTAFWRALER